MGRAACSVVAVLLVAFWRGRRLGPVVAERLPVVVRAAETVEGRGRLYRARRARDRAAAALGAGRSTGSPPGSASPRRRAGRRVVAAIAVRTGQDPQEVGAALYGPPPADDAGLVGLARILGRHREEAVIVTTSPGDRPDLPRPATRPRDALTALRAEVAKAVVGQDAVVTGLVIALLCRGHVLLEGVPGVAKTLLVRTLSAALSLDFKRVQFTPDLMPGDVTGSLVYDARTARVRVPRGAGLHQPAAGRRDQPHPAEDAGRAAGGDGGAAGQRGGRRARAARPVRGVPRRRTRSSTRAPTRCPRRSSTGSCSS